MSDYQNCSERTKRRKISAKVAEIIRSVCNVDVEEESNININGPSKSGPTNLHHSLRSITDQPVPTETRINEINVDERQIRSLEKGNRDIFDTDDDVNSDDKSYDDEDEIFEDDDVFLFDDEFNYGEFSDSSSEIGSEEEDLPERQQDLQEQLRKWADCYSISHTALNPLLVILRQYHSLPRDSRTLLETPRHTVIKAIGGGSYYHFGVKSFIEQVFKHMATSDANCINFLDAITLHIGIDGLKLFNKANDSFLVSYFVYYQGI